MSVWYTQSEATAAQRKTSFVALSSITGTASTGLSITGAELQVRKAGGAYANFAGTITERTDGEYEYEFTSGELDTLGPIVIKLEKTNVLIVIQQCGQVVATDPNDASGMPDGALIAVKFGNDASVKAIRSATAAAGAAMTITLDGSASATDNFYRGRVIQIISATGIGQSRRIMAYVGSTKVATIDRPWIINPDATSVFVIHGGDGGMPVLDLVAAVVTDAGNLATTFKTDLPSSTNDAYNDAFLTFVSGTLADQTHKIIDYIGSTKFSVFAAPGFTATPTGGDRFYIVNK